LELLELPALVPRPRRQVVRRFRARDHRGRDVDADRAAPRGGATEQARRPAAPAAEIQDLLAGADAHAGDDLSHDVAVSIGQALGLTVLGPAVESGDDLLVAHRCERVARPELERM